LEALHTCTHVWELVSTHDLGSWLHLHACMEDLRDSVSLLSTTRIAGSSLSTTNTCSRMVVRIYLRILHLLHEYGANTLAAYFLSKKFLMMVMTTVHENQMAVARGRCMWLSTLIA
jgi:hypothetical protein